MASVLTSMHTAMTMKNPRTASPGSRRTYLGNAGPQIVAAIFPTAKPALLLSSRVHERFVTLPSTPHVN